MADTAQMQVSDEVAITIQNMNKWYGTFHVLREHRSYGEPWRTDCCLWSIWFWQIDAHPVHQRTGRAPAGIDRSRWHIVVLGPQKHRQDPFRGGDVFPAL